MPDTRYQMTDDKRRSDCTLHIADCGSPEDAHGTGHGIRITTPQYCSKPLTLFKHLTYNAVLHTLTPLLGLYLLYRLLVEGKGRQALPYLTGSFPAKWRQTSGRPRLWVHAVSVGEVMAAHAVIAKLRERLPNSWILLTTITDTGFATAKRVVKDADEIAFLPLDFPLFVNRALHTAAPDVLILVETELWPNLLHAAKAFGAKVVLANGRISNAMFSNARGAVKPFYRWVLPYVDVFAMRTPLDAERLLQLGVPADKVLLTGDVKLDQPSVKMDDLQRRRLRWELGIKADALVWMGGSTHEGEEAQLLEAHWKLVHRFQDLRLVLAPRQIERVDAVERLVREKGFLPLRRTKLKAHPIIGDASDVIIVDTMGELANLYAAADVVFVGGSFIRRGGHNLLEPARQGKPVLFGPHVDNFRMHAAMLQSGGVGFCVRSTEELTSLVERLLDSSEWRQHIAEQAETLIQAHQGAADRTARLITHMLDSSRSYAVGS